MKPTIVLCFLAIPMLGLSHGMRMVGGWTEQDPSGDPKYLELAHFAIAQQTAGETYYHTVLRLLKVETQVVAGVNYKIIFETAPSSCKISDGPYSSERCTPTTNQASAACTAIIYERAWDNFKQLTSFRCHR